MQIMIKQHMLTKKKELSKGFHFFPIQCTFERCASKKRNERQRDGQDSTCFRTGENNCFLDVDASSVLLIKACEPVGGLEVELEATSRMTAL